MGFEPTSRLRDYLISSLLVILPRADSFMSLSGCFVRGENRIKSGFLAYKPLSHLRFRNVGSNRHFRRFWGENREDRGEKNGRRQYKNLYTAEQSFKPTKSMFEVYQMKNLLIDWNSIPDVMNKDQFYRLCHISKSTALHLLKSGKVPCEWSGKKTRCYKIKKEDVKAYLEERAVFPELYSAPRGWYGSHYVARLSAELPEEVLAKMHDYYTKLLEKYKDVVTVQEVAALTGYSKTTINNWCNKGALKSFRKQQIFYIPKIFLVEFFCSLTFRSITRKSLWHIQTLNDFQRKLNNKK